MEIVKGANAAFLEDSRALVVSDLHIGFEIEMGRAGVFVPDQGPSFLARLGSLAESTKAKRIVLLGDVKHSFEKPTYEEEDSVVEFLSGLAKIAKVDIIPGNHDGELGNVLPRGVKIHPAAGAVIGKTGLAHGHAWPDKSLLDAENLLLSHLHPNIAFVDSLGTFHKEPCFLLGGLLPAQVEFNYPRAPASARVMIMPAFNTLLGGAIVQEIDFASGFWKCIRRESMQVILADGTILGKLGEIEKGWTAR